MNHPFDPYNACIALWMQMSRANQCRAVDDMLAHMGPRAPVPEFENIKIEAESWAAMLTGQELKVYMAAAFEALDDDSKEAAVKYFMKKANQEREEMKTPPVE